jgi:hypothetical protein
MKVAVCISGEPRGQEELVLASIKKYLPWDCFTHTWQETQMPDLPDTQSFVRAFNKYIASLSRENPSRIWFSKKFDNGFKQHSRIYQHYNHWHCLQKVPVEYDMIVRVRPDVVLYEHDWQSDVLTAYELDLLYGYGSGQGVEQGLVDRFASDFVILHRRERMRNPYTIDLCPGHVGWWICLHKHMHERFVNNNSVVKLVREL